MRGSAVRRALDLGFDGMTWPERFVATNVRFPDDRDGLGAVDVLRRRRLRRNHRQDRRVR